MPPGGAGVLELEHENNRRVPPTPIGTPRAPGAMQGAQARNAEQGRAKAAEWEYHQLLEKRRLPDKVAELSRS